MSLFAALATDGNANINDAQVNNNPFLILIKSSLNVKRTNLYLGKVRKVCPLRIYHYIKLI